MEIAIKPIKKLNAEIECPKSKGYTNRALMIAALAKGTSRLRNALKSEDTEHMANALKKFGAEIKEEENLITVKGTEGKLKRTSSDLYVGNSGTTMRFLTAAATLAEGEVAITGDNRMNERPIQDLAEGLKQLGAEIKTEKGFPPVTTRGKLKGGNAKVSGKTSSQYLSAILMVAPYAEKDTEIEITDELTSKPFIDMTIDIMKSFGIKPENREYKKFTVKSGQKYTAKDYAVEGDYSNASYFFAAAAITKGKIKVTGINPESAQGDKKFLDLLERMGCKVKKGENWIQVTGSELKGIDADMNSMPDVAQTLAVVAAFAKGKTTIRNIGNLRIKETDRIKAMATELRKIGAKATETENGLIIEPGKLHGANIETYNDHRMAMSFAIAGLAIPGITIKGAECVSKTFPEFFNQLKKVC